MQYTTEQIQGAIAAALSKSSDFSFRARLLKEPIAALNEAGGLDLPLNTPIRFTDKAEPIPVLLPAFGTDPDEITDEEILSSVSGGLSPVIVISAIYIAAVAVLTELAKDKRPI